MNMSITLEVSIDTILGRVPTKQEVGELISNWVNNNFNTSPYEGEESEYYITVKNSDLQIIQKGDELVIEDSRS